MPKIGNICQYILRKVSKIFAVSTVIAYANRKMTSNALSFDLEEWYHPEAIRQSKLQVTRSSQVVEATTPILDCLAHYGVKATFFTVGEVAAAHPHLIERLLNDGHELAFHGWTHDPLWVMTPQGFAAEIEQFLKWRDQHFAGVDILGFRAPTFSLDANTAWAISVLLDHGFHYDSSIFPARTPLYGVPQAPLEPYYLNATDLQDSIPNSANKRLLEIPMSVFPLLGLRIGFTGGLYLRALPYGVIRWLMMATNRARRAAVMYIHPWETYAATPRCKLSWGGRMVLYYGLPSFDKLEHLLRDFQFDTMQKLFLHSAV